MTLKKKIQAALNIPDEHFGNHESDLYVKYSLELDSWLRENYEFYGNITKFRNQIDHTTWMDIPFAHVKDK